MRYTNFSLSQNSKLLKNMLWSFLIPLQVLRAQQNIHPGFCWPWWLTDIFAISEGEWLLTTPHQSPHSNKKGELVARAVQNRDMLSSAPASFPDREEGHCPLCAHYQLIEICILTSIHGQWEMLLHNFA